MSSVSASASPLPQRPLTPLPLGAIKPGGWLRDQLRVQADGLTGHLDEFWPSVAQSRWIGGDNEGWERAPYWLDGLIPLAALLDDDRLLRKARHWVDHILAGQHPDGWLGPVDDPHEGTGEIVLDPWPQFVLFKALTQWQEATGDDRVIPAMRRAMRRIAALLAERPLSSWARMRWADLVLSAHWLYERTGDEALLELAELAHAQGYDWQTHFADLPVKDKVDPSWLATLSDEEALRWHGVNNAMGVKAGAVWARQSGSERDSQSSMEAVAALDKYHGQATGMFSGDEHLAGRSPVQGTETCTVVEYLFTLEQMLAVTGAAALGDKLEQIAYNALPASMTADMGARQYDQQPNQVLCTRARRDWVSNGADSNLYSLEGNFGCCTANLHQGWPKFVSHLWMATPEGIAAVAYGPCTVTTEIKGVRVTIEEATDYPFRGEVRLTLHVSRPVTFPLLLRVPVWAQGTMVSVGTGPAQAASAGRFHHILQEWQDGDTVTLSLPMDVRTEPRDNGAASVWRGPLLMALQIGEEFRQIGGERPHADWEVHPATPWSYALAENAASDAKEREAPISPVPFDSGSPPVTLTLPAQRVPTWTLENDSAAPPPSGIVADPAAMESVMLVPYGSTRLRISEFPVAH